MKESGKFVLRISPKLHSELKRQARQKNISLNQEIVERLMVQNSLDYLLPLKQQFGDSLLGVVLFGSVARSEQRASSDIDLLIVLDEKVKIERQLYRTWDEKLSDAIGPKYSPQFSHLPKKGSQISSLWLESSLEGDILYDATGALRKTIYEIKNQIAQGYYVRRMTNGHPYWVYRGVDDEQSKSR